MPVPKELQYYVPDARTSRLAIVAAILGCVWAPSSLCFIGFWALDVEGMEGHHRAPFWLECLWNLIGLAAILAPIIVGVVALRRIKRSSGKLKGGGLAQAGVAVPAVILAYLLFCLVEPLIRPFFAS